MIDWKWTEVDELESQEKWNEVKLLLIETWRQNPDDLKVLIRLGFFCWYLLVEEVTVGVKDVDLDELETVLNEVTHVGLAAFMHNEDFLWIFGYMISLFPYYFGDYEEWEEKGEAMLRRAHELRPNEPVYRYSYLASFIEIIEIIEQHEEAFYQVQAVLEDRFQGEGLLSTYFKEIWQSQIEY